MLIEPDHPVPQRLAVHAADPRRFRTRRAIQDRRYRQQPPGPRHILRSCRKPPQLCRREVLPHRNRLAHGKHPQFASFNHAYADSGIVQHRESATPRIGINPIRWYYG